MFDVKNENYLNNTDWYCLSIIQRMRSAHKTILHALKIVNLNKNNTAVY